MQPDYIGERTDYRTIRIRISDWCNFNCTYCIEHDTLPKDRFIGQFDLLCILENLKRKDGVTSLIKEIINGKCI